MKTVLVLGAGRSSGALISYLLRKATTYSWRLVVADLSVENARYQLGDSTDAEAIEFDIHNEPATREVITSANVVISLLPPAFHVAVARHCVELGKHMLTASYISPEMKKLHDEAVSKGVLVLNECGLDPGIDHMSAMLMIDRIKGEGGRLVSFESFTGGLIAPETDKDNPWRYKFTWNPRNVVTAGQSVAKYLHEGKVKYIPYSQLFARLTEVHIPGLGTFEGYANRDSLSYIESYGLSGIRTMLRGTLRQQGFCEAWNIFVQLGCCDDSYEMENVQRMTHLDYLNTFLPETPGMNVRQKIATLLRITEDAEVLQYLAWSGFFSEVPVGLTSGTPARVLEHILNKRWRLMAGDKDMIVMWHRFRYEKAGQIADAQSSLVVKGEDDHHLTAMAKTVGLPLGIVAKLLLEGKIKERGVVMPIKEEFYLPVLKELEEYGIKFSEEHF